MSSSSRSTGSTRTLTDRRPAHLRRHRRADRARRHHGRRQHRDQRRHHHGGARGGLVRTRRHHPARSTRTGAARRRRRSRFERGRDPQGMDRAIARFVELLRETCPDLAVAPARSTLGGTLPPADRTCRVRTDRVNAVARHVAHDRRDRRAARPHRLRARRSRRTRRADDPACRRGGPTAPTRSTSSRRSPASTGSLGSAALVPTSTEHGALSPRQSDRRLRRARCCSAPASRRRCRTPSSPRATWHAPVSRPRRSPSPTRSSPRRACCARRCARACSPRSGSTRRTAGRGPRCSRSATCTGVPAQTQPLPDEREVLAVALAGGDALAAVAVWHELVARAGAGRPVGRARRRAGRAASDPFGRAGRPRRRSARPGGRDRSRRGARRSASTSGWRWLEVDLDRAAGPPARPGHVPAGQPVPVERPRPGVHHARRRHRRGAGRRHPVGGRDAARRPAPVRPLPGRGRAGGQPQRWRGACGSRPPTARWSTPTSPVSGMPASPRRRRWARRCGPDRRSALGRTPASHPSQSARRPWRRGRAALHAPGSSNIS